MNKRILASSTVEFIESFVVAFLVLMIVYVLIAFPVEVSGKSMSPNLETGDRLLIEKITHNFNKYNRGDIVVLHPPDSDYIDYIKRVVGVPGDSIKIYDCRVYISRDNSKYILDESTYLDKEVCTNGSKSLIDGRIYTLGEREYVVMGDNRGNSQDSRFFGIIHENRIQGKVVARFWPFDKVKLY